MRGREGEGERGREEVRKQDSHGGLTSVIFNKRMEKWAN